jgi:hypothetical protein
MEDIRVHRVRKVNDSTVRNSQAMDESFDFTICHHDPICQPQERTKGPTRKPRRKKLVIKVTTRAKFNEATSSKEIPHCHGQPTRGAYVMGMIDVSSSQAQQIPETT